MQLAGNPSLIDPTRAIAAQAIRNEPLEFEQVEVSTISGESGQRLEELYAIYSAPGGPGCRRTARRDEFAGTAPIGKRVGNNRRNSRAAHQQLAIIRAKSEHLHHLDLAAARLEAFRPISHAVVTLATIVRGEEPNDR